MFDDKKDAVQKEKQPMAVFDGNKKDVIQKEKQPMAGPMGAIIVDDNRLERDGIAKMLRAMELPIEIKASFDNGEAAFSYLKENGADIVVSDIQMPFLTGLELTRRLKEEEIQTKVIFVSCYDDFEYARCALSLDAVGYVLKPVVKSDLKSAVLKAVELIKKEQSAVLDLERLREQIGDTFAQKHEEYFRDLLLNSDVDIRTIHAEIGALIVSGNRDACGEFIRKYLGAAGGVKNPTYLNNFAHAVVYSVRLTLLEYNKSLETEVGSAVWQKLSDFDSIVNFGQWILNILYFSIEILNSQKGDERERIVAKIKEIVAARYNAHLTVSDIADELLYSAKYLNYTFRGFTGKSIFDYLTVYRMEKAKELLKEPNSKIYAVAELVGYKRTTHFNDLFKQYTGLSPAEYKNRQ